MSDKTGLALNLDYQDMFQRNAPIIDSSLQKKISEVRLVVAGCGSTGGAFIDGAVRLGVLHYKLADLGRYEINNLNRQMVEISHVDQNKAATYAKKLKAINPLCQIETFEEGLTQANMDRFLEGSTLVFDAVDVTTTSGMEVKMLLHERAALKGLQVASALDLGFTQWIKGYNYKKGDQALEGNLEKARKCDNPLKALILGFISVEDFPLEIVDEVHRLMTNPGTSACQLGAACFLLSALVSPYLIHQINEKSIPPMIQVDLLSFFLSPGEIEKRNMVTAEKRKNLKRFLGI